MISSFLSVLFCLVAIQSNVLVIMCHPYANVLVKWWDSCRRIQYSERCHFIIRKMPDVTEMRRDLVFSHFILPIKSMRTFFKNPLSIRIIEHFYGINYDFVHTNIHSSKIKICITHNFQDEFHSHAIERLRILKFYLFILK